MCDCEFQDNPHDPEGDDWYYRRVCMSCSHVYYSLHCEHDGIQRPCHGCGIVPKPVEDVW